MKNEFVTIKIKKSSLEKLKEAVDVINNKKNNSKKSTVAGLVTQLADSYSEQMDDGTIYGNQESWITDGVPIILDSDANRHFIELKKYYPIDCSVMISNYIRELAMNERFKLSKNKFNKEES